MSDDLATNESPHPKAEAPSTQGSTSGGGHACPHQTHLGGDRGPLESLRLWLSRLLCSHRFAFSKREPGYRGAAILVHQCLRCGTERRRYQ